VNADCIVLKEIRKNNFFLLKRNSIKMTDIEYKYEPKSEKQLKNFCRRKVKLNVSGFRDEVDFLCWYKEQEYKCCICGLAEIELQEIVRRGLLKSKRFPERGLLTRGRTRGLWLEIDRNDVSQHYSRLNCTLLCYFCNNDKSDVFTLNQYKDYFKNRIEFFGKLLKNDK